MPLSPRVPDLRALDLLLSVARLGSLGRAAAEHGITQPAAGSRIRHLENLVGQPLIERSALGSRLTTEGALVADWAREVVGAANSLDAGLDALRTRTEGRIRLGASLTVSEYLAPHWLLALRARRPDAAISLRAVNSSEVARLVLEGEVDLGFLEGPELPDGLEARTIARDELVLVVGPGSTWARRRRAMTIEELLGVGLVAREPGSGTRHALEAALADQGRLAEPVVELSSMTAIKAAVEDGVGPAVLSSLAVAGEIALGRLRRIEVDGLQVRRELRAVWPSGRRHSPVLRDVLAVAVERSPDGDDEE
ncbi:LysR family transcriptional regulator [Actinomycetospora sp. NBRC 106378]|uniref:LysR family transcriptional regulator n=1 Tax=Actinomycetospora sp. NBRC 106378 TaxID=3032208 RepID=UPI0025566D3E|nr:LysR family transcriptional regulator [Actinomycetospora sp. NBRC 106378]